MKSNHPFISAVRRKVWAILIAFMVGVNNFYKGEEKTPDDMRIKIEVYEEQEDGAPKDDNVLLSKKEQTTR